MAHFEINKEASTKAIIKANKGKWSKLSRRILEKLREAAQRTDVPDKFLIDKELRIYPSADLVYSFTTSDKVVFAELMGSVMEEKMYTKGLKVKSQVTMAAAKEINIKNANVRFDVLGENKYYLMATDMQNDTRKSLTDDRSPYYHAVILASQKVEKMRYDKLKTVCVTFIMPKKELKNSDGIRQLEWADVKTKEFIENSDRRYFLYIPTILKSERIRVENPTLYMFARFYEILTQEQADKFLNDYKDNPLARRLIHMSNVLYEERTNLDDLYTIPYYDRRVFIEALAEKNEVIAEKDEVIAENRIVLAEKDEALAEKDAQIAKLIAQLNKKNGGLVEH